MTELHLHLDGSMRPQTVYELLKRQGLREDITSVEQTKERMQVGKECQSLNEYLSKFELPCLVLQDAESVERAVYELAKDVYQQGVDYVEIRFAPMLSTQKALNEQEVTAAAVRGAKRAMAELKDLTVGLILCCMRGEDTHEANMRTIRAAHSFYGDVVCALDLAGAEALFQTQEYEAEFALASELNIPYTIHAGEADGPESIRRALEMGAVRIGHGVRCIEDRALVKELAQKRIPLEVCVTSNLQTKAVGTAKHPIKQLLEAGICVTLNTDNRTVSGTTLDQEIQLIKEQFQITDEEIAQMEQNAREARFIK